jgi:hypothetical protein
LQFECEKFVQHVALAIFALGGVKLGIVKLKLVNQIRGLIINALKRALYDTDHL